MLFLPGEVVLSFTLTDGQFVALFDLISVCNVIRHTSLGRNKTDEFTEINLRLNLTTLCSATGIKSLQHSTCGNF